MSELLRRFVATLEQTERLPPAAMRRYQERLLVPLVRHALAHVPFYRGNAALARAVRDDDTIDWDAWAEVPVLTRAAIEARNDDIEADHLPDRELPTWERRTSGSTGRRLRILHGVSYSFSFHACVQRLYRWTRADPRGRYASLRVCSPGTADYPQGRTFTAWDEGSAMLGIAGQHRVLDIRTDPDDQARWVAQEAPDALFTTPRNLLRVAESALRLGLGVHIPVIHTGREPMTDHIRQSAQAAFGSLLSHNYGSAECGHMAQQCPRCGAYHVHADSLLLEALRADGAPCAPGQAGRVVVTHLYEYAMPLLRYEIGDIAVAGAPNDCTITLPTLVDVLGKSRHMFRTPDGDLFWPGDLTPEILRLFGTSRFQLAQVGPADIELRLAGLDAEPDSPARAALADILARRWPMGCALTVRRIDEVPFAASAKRWDFVREMDD